MVKYHDAQQHREELSRDCDHDEGETTEMLNDLEDEQLTQTTEEGVCEYRRDGCWVGA